MSQTIFPIPAIWLSGGPGGHVGAEQVAQSLRNNELAGYVISHDDGKTAALVIGISKRLVGFLAEQPSFTIGQTIAQPFEFLPQDVKLLHAEPQKKPRRKLQIVRITPEGALIGWAIGTPEVNIFVGGGFACTAQANAFRERLVTRGFGAGFHGFRAQLPDKFLTGKRCIIRVEAAEGQGHAEKELQLPRHFPHQQEAFRSESIANEMVFGLSERATCAAKQAIDENPELIFRDWGLGARAVQDRMHMPDFSQLLDHRLGLLNNNTPCARGQACCKNNVLGQSLDHWLPGSGADPDRLQHMLRDCPQKARFFASKLAVKSYAEIIGAAVPKTLAVLRSPAQFAAFEFPKRYVLKPDYESGRAVFLMHNGYDLCNEAATLPIPEISDYVHSYLDKHAGAGFIVEEFLCQQGVAVDAPFIPLDYKFHCFGGKARIVQIADRNIVSRHPLRPRLSWLARDGSPAPAPMRSIPIPMLAQALPGCYDQMLTLADRIATDIDDYIRVDLYATDAGPVLGEITTYCNSGRGFSGFGDFVLSQAWALYA